MSEHRKSVEWITNRFAVWGVRFVTARLNQLARDGERFDEMTTGEIAADMARVIADDLEFALETRPWLQNASFTSDPKPKKRTAKKERM